MKTYVFGIGGTGARVIKSFVMLMSAGIDMHTDEIVPIFIDPDNAAADLTRTVTVLRSYQIINEHILFTKTWKINSLKRGSVNLFQVLK